jgi:hypothetical protein
VRPPAPYFWTDDKLAQPRAGTRINLASSACPLSAGDIWPEFALNPTCTIQALALYIADNIKKRLATLFD